MKLASPAVPEGVWLCLPGPLEDDYEDTMEEVLALRELRGMPLARICSSVMPASSSLHLPDSSRLARCIQS